MAQNDHETVDMLLVGAGIMSATLAVLSLLAWLGGYKRSWGLG